VLAGLEYTNENARRWSYAATGTIPPTTVGSPNPYPALPPGFFDQARTDEVNYKSNSVGLYAQDIMDLTPVWKIMLGARWDLLDAEYQRALPLGPLDRTDRVWSYRTGLIYQPSDVQMYYAAYGTSFNPSAELYSLDVRGTNTPPEESFNAEIGAKWELLDGNLSLRTAIYRTEKTNERNTDPLVADQFLLSGRRHTDGIEVEMAGKLTPNWDIFAGGTVMRARIDESINASDIGKVPLYVPPYTANLWTVYNFGHGFRAGGGFNAVGKRYGNLQNTNVAPAYVRWDAMASYEQRNWLVRLNLINALNETYYDSVYAGHVIPGSARVIQATLELRY
jgi:catecholate siderophore receptor